MLEGLIKEVVDKLIIQLVTSRITPKITTLLNKSEKYLYGKGKLFTHDLYKNRFEDYLGRRYTKFFILDTLVFPNYQTTFDTLYVPLTLITTESNKKIEVKIDNYPEDILHKYHRVLVQDTAGMGKSTLIRKIFLSCIRENMAIPVLIELRKLSDENRIINELISQLNSFEKEIEIEFILDLIDRGDFLFLFDGFDEITLQSREVVLADLKEFIEKSGNNYFVITSRPEESLSSFGDFQKFNIQPLDEDEAYELFAKYDNYSYRPIADDLTELLKKGKYPSVKEFLKNPFLTSLLYKTFDFKKDIPFEKEQFYRQVFDALYENHDLTKEGYYKREKYSSLHIDNFEKVLRGVGYKTMRRGSVEFKKNTILEIIEQVKEFRIGLDFNPSDFLNDLVKTVPLFRKDGLFFKWSHKSFQDYFTARFIQLDAKDKVEGILQELFKSHHNENVLDLLYSMDYQSIRHFIVKDILSEFLDYIKESGALFSGINRGLIVERIEYAYKKNIMLFYTTIDELESEYLPNDHYLDIYEKETGHKIGAHDNLGYELENGKFLWMIWSGNFAISFLSRRISRVFNKDERLFDDFSGLDSLFEGRKHLVIDTEPSNPCNQIDNFPVVNQALKVFLGNISLSFEACNHELVQISEEIKALERGDFF